MNKKSKLDNKGFSLMELLVCLAISSMVILAALSLVLVGTKSYDNNSKNTTIQKEVSFTTNILAETIRNADQNSTVIKYFDSTNEIEIHTGKNVLYYDEDTSSLYIYEEDSTKPVGDSVYRVTDDDYLISKYVKNFKAEYISADAATPDRSAVDYLTGDGANAVTASAKYNAIEFTMDFEYKNKSDSTKVIYKIRNAG